MSTDQFKLTITPTDINNSTTITSTVNSTTDSIQHQQPTIFILLIVIAALIAIVSIVNSFNTVASKAKNTIRDYEKNLNM